MILITFLLAHIQNIRTDNETTTFTDVVITQANYILELAALYLYCIILHVCTYLHRYDYVHFQNTMAAAWAQAGEANRNYLLRSIRLKVHVVIATLLFLFALQLCINSTRSDNLWKIILVTFSFILPQMIQFISLAFYYILLMIVGALLSDINMQLESLTKPKLIYDEFIVKVVERKSVSLRQMELAYLGAFELSKGVNDAYNGPLLISTIQCFHCIVSEAHIIYREIIVSTYTAHTLANGSIWIIYQLLKVYCVAFSGSLLKKEALKIVQTLHKIPIEGHDRRTYTEIQHFCTMMNYHGFELSVYELFTIDANLFSTVSYEF
ncbi:uncharacterized protein LOC126371995 [Pectinophora gossypiella]|uniref:uncharacterized protein LOC126371995 n=1 Tax=Pectinophora gossypiella TaxID=13191 RepID=UPI00214E9B51|nr:uncharacterized protein LOC126371995 [Pectinophora gossypiella]